MLVVQGTVVSAEHVSHDPARQPLNLKKFIREFDLPVIVGGCASYSTALHLMRTGAVGVLVGVGPGHACTTPRRARHRCAAGHRDRRRGRRPDPSPRRDRRVRARDRRRRHAHRWRHRQGDRVRCRRGDDRFAARRRVRGARPRLPLGHGDVPPHAAARRACERGPARRRSPRSSSGPRTRTTARSTSSARLRTSMATTGYETVKEFQKAEVMVAPVAADRGQVAPAVAGRRHGPLTHRAGADPEARYPPSRTGDGRPEVEPHA